MKQLLLFTILAFHLTAQTNLKSAFVSANLGINDITQSQFATKYYSNIGLAPAISLGLPLSTQTYLFGRVSYFSKNGIPVTNTFENQNGQYVQDARTNGSAKYREWILNTGILTKNFLSENYSLDIDGGLFFVNEKEEQKEQDGTILYSSSDHGFMGFFGGIVLERNFGRSPFSLIGDIQFNLSIPGVFYLIPNNGGINATVGLRYYFKDRRME